MFQSAIDAVKAVIIVFIVFGIGLLAIKTAPNIPTHEDEILPLQHITLYSESGEVIEEWTGRYRVFDHKNHITLFAGPYTNRQRVAVIYGNAITVELVEEE